MAKNRLILFLLPLALLILALAARPAPAAPNDVAVYDDALATGWNDWSWGGIDRDLANADPVHGGTASITVTYTGGWSGLQFGRNDALDVTGHDRLRFWVHGGSQGGQQVQVSAGNGCTSVSQAFTPTAGTWTMVEVPLRDLGRQMSVTYLSWFNATPGAQPTFYLDDIAFIEEVGPTPTPVPPVAGPALSIDASADRHVISPYIYGMNFADEALAAELRLPVRRWGGNATTRYNWKIDVSNRAMDWFYENIPNPDPGTLPDGSEADLFVEQNLRTGTETLLTVPLIGWAPKSRDVECGFRVSRYGEQERTDPWQPDCGNGIRTDGTVITGNNPLDTSIPITPTFVQEWINHLVSRYGTAEEGGVQFYNLDNEPMLWSDTHRDVHPEPTSYDEMRDRTYAYGAAIKEADPGAKTLGPVVWGWTAYFWSALDWSEGGDWWNHPQDRLAHDDVPFLEWYLRQMRDYELQHGARILDYLDVHFYPQANGVFSDQAGDASTQALRLRSTRALWDSTYVDESWIDEPVYLIPRMRQWVADNYPGTGTAISEYNWGAQCHINGALAQAEVLGIFGRERLDLATLWGPPQADQPAAYAFRMYLNYDGSGSAFGDIGVSASSADPGSLSVFASQRSEDGALTLMILNKTAQPLTSSVSLAGFTPAATAAVYRYSDQSPDTIFREADQAVRAGSFTAVFPANSITLLVIPEVGETVERVYLPFVER